MNKIQTVLASRSSKVVGSVVALATVVAVPSLAGADTISSAFTAEQTTLVGYLGDAVTMVIALLSLGVGIRFLVKWVRKAAAGS